MEYENNLVLIKPKEDEAEKFCFDRFEIACKNSLYGVLCLLLRSHEVGFYQLTFIMVVTTLQLLSLVFNPNIDFPWKVDTFGDYFEKALQGVQFMYWCKVSKSFTFYLILFYISIIFVLFALCIIAYSVYQLLQKKMALPWLITFVKHILGLFTSCLFIPIFDLFISMLTCTADNSGASYLTDFQDSNIKCWSGMHIMHASFAIVFSFFFWVLCFVTVLFFFEAQTMTNDYSAKQHNRNDLHGLLLKTVYIILTNFCASSQYFWFLALVFIVGSIFTFLKQRQDRPFYVESINLISDVLNGVFMWACFMLIVALLSESSKFNGGIQIFLMGLPLSIFLVVTKRDWRSALLLRNLGEFESGEDWNAKVRYYLNLVARKDISRDLFVELKGFIFHHEESCQIVSCPLKRYKGNITTQNKDISKKKRAAQMATENLMLLFSFANELYLQGLSKFPNCTYLRISYAIFLKEKLGKKTIAISELLLAEKSNPAIDEVFTIARYRKLIEDEMSELSTGNFGSQLDAATMIAFDNYFIQFKQALEKAAVCHKEFWQEILEQDPDLKKLDKEGQRINVALAAVEEYWKKMIKLIPNSPKAHKTYGDFLIEILNDAETGSEYQLKAKEATAEKVMTAVLDSNLSGIPEICASMGGADGTPCVIATSDEGKFGEITQINLSVCKLFGYTKTEMISRKINFLMPDVYAKSHDQILHNALQQSETIGGTPGKTEKFVLGKHKSGYLIAVSVQARVFANMSQGVLFAATFRTEKKSCNACYLLLNGNNDIVGVNSRCIEILGISNRMLRQSRLSAQALAPGLFEKNKSTQLITKQGSTIEFKIPEKEALEESKSPANASVASSLGGRGDNSVMGSFQHSGSIALSSSGLDLPLKRIKARASKKSIMLNCIMTEILFPNQPAQHIVRLEPLEDLQLTGSPKIDKRPKHPNFQWYFDPMGMRYCTEVREADAQKRMEEEASGFVSILSIRNQERDDKEESDDVSIKDQTDEEWKKDSSMVSADQKASKSESPAEMMAKLAQRRERYGAGIRLYRLENGEIKEVKYEKARLFDRTDSDHEETGVRSEQEKILKEQRGDSFANSIKSKKAFNEALNDKTAPTAISRLKKTGYIIVLSLLALAAAEFGVTISQFRDISENIEMARYSFLRIFTQMKMAFEINRIVLIMKSTEPRLRPSLPSVEILTSQKALDAALSEYYDFQNKLSLSTLSLNKEHADLYSTKCVKLVYYTLNSRYFCCPCFSHKKHNKLRTVAWIPRMTQLKILL